MYTDIYSFARQWDYFALDKNTTYFHVSSETERCNDVGNLTSFPSSHCAREMHIEHHDSIC